MSEDRVYLTWDDPDANHAEWMQQVQVQTGQPFTVEGSALCAVEEMLELLAAEDPDDAKDAAGDSYIAIGTFTAILLNQFLQRNPDGPCGGPYVGNPLSGGHVQDTIRQQVRFILLLTNIARKGWSAIEKVGGAPAVLQQCTDWRTTIRRDCDHAWVEEGGFSSVIEPVLDILDGRLQKGYQMRDGSAIKTEDQ